jgi:hypothetical protein
MNLHSNARLTLRSRADLVEAVTKEGLTLKRPAAEGRDDADAVGRLPVRLADSGDLQKRRVKVDPRNQRFAHGSGLGDTGPPHDERHPGATLE